MATTRLSGASLEASGEMLTKLYTEMLKSEGGRDLVKVELRQWQANDVSDYVLERLVRIDGQPMSQGWIATRHSTERCNRKDNRLC